MGPRTLVLMRHGKSDWSVDSSDRDRPLNDRGRRQAAEAGRWLEANGGEIDLALVSPATRAACAWDIAAAELSAPPPVRVEEAAYTFDGLALLALVRALDSEERVVLVGHNPACEELVELLTGEGAVMKTSALAVLELPDWRCAGRLVAHGRPDPPRASSLRTERRLVVPPTHPALAPDRASGGVGERRTALPVGCGSDGPRFRWGDPGMGPRAWPHTCWVGRSPGVGR